MNPAIQPVSMPAPGCYPRALQGHHGRTATEGVNMARTKLADPEPQEAQATTTNGPKDEWAGLPGLRA